MDSSEEQEEYEVEKILNYGYIDGILSYHVKWVGYDDPEDMTWEPYHHLSTCKQLVKEYFKSLGIKRPPEKESKQTESKPHKHTIHREKHEKTGGKETKQSQKKAQVKREAIPLQNYLAQKLPDFKCPNTKTSSWFPKLKPKEINSEYTSFPIFTNKNSQTFDLQGKQISRNTAILLFPSMFTDSQ